MTRWGVYAMINTTLVTQGYNQTIAYRYFFSDNDSKLTLNLISGNGTNVILMRETIDEKIVGTWKKRSDNSTVTFTRDGKVFFSISNYQADYGMGGNNLIEWSGQAGFFIGTYSFEGENTLKIAGNNGMKETFTRQPSSYKM
jgi:hypothetical protein